MSEIGKHVQTQIDRNTYRKLIMKCSQENLKISEALRQLISQWVKDVDKEVLIHA
jgi:hypothetical protein